MGIGELVGGGQLYLALPIALLAGLVSFLSPCILPLVPGYLGYVGGASGDGGRRDRGRLVLGVLLFVLGFTVIFTAYVTVAGVLGAWLTINSGLITRFAGVIVIVLGLVFIGQFSFMQRSVKPKWAPATGLAGAPLLGIIFGLGWAPCVSPTLGAISNIALTSGSAPIGIVLGLAYSIGLGLPFLLAAFGFSWFTTGTKWAKRHIRVINIVGGVALVIMGILMVTGVWSLWMQSLQGVISDFTPAL
ncbi:cytochrome c biogenesis CcdA family protein [soil metagenome]